MADAKDPEISALLHEDRVFEPPAEFRANAIVRDARRYEEAERDPEAFWAKFASELEWSRPVDQRARLESAARQVVRRRPAQRVASTASIATSAARAATRRPSSGKASPAIAAR